MFRFDSIYMKNFRQYQDMELDFPKTTACDIHILIASNGVGKTNLLNGINWCLYGDEPHTSGAKKSRINDDDKLPLCNIISLEDAKGQDSISVPVIVSIHASEDTYSFEFYRERNFDPVTRMQKGSDVFRVIETMPDGTTNIYENEDANDVVELTMPRNIRQYFFFDSEQLIDYVDVGADQENNLRKSIFAISGVDSVQKAIDRLATIENEIRKRIKKLNPQLEAKEEAVSKAEENYNRTKAEIEDCKEQISISEREIEKANDFIYGQEGLVDDNKAFNRNKEQIKILEEQKEDLKRELQSFVRKYMVLLALYGKNRVTSDYIKERQSADSLKTNINVEAIEDSLANHKCRLCTQGIPHDIEDDLRLLVQKYKANASLQLLSKINNDVNRSLNVFDYQENKEALFEKVDNCEDQIRVLEEENTKLNERIKRGAKIEEVELNLKKRDEHSRLLEDNKYKKRRLEDQIQNLVKELSDKKRELQEALDDSEKSRQEKERLAFIGSALEYSEKIKTEIVNNIKAQMQENAMDLFLQLIWKKDTYDHIELDDAFKIKLFDKLTKKSCFGSASAGEKQLMALAFTIALHEVSGYDNLLFIDTPVGRISDDNRRNFARTLLNISRKKQLILAFTSAEFSDEVSSIMTDDLLSSKLLLTVDESERITILGGRV